MVRVPGSSGDSGFHRESQEDVKIKHEADLDQDPDLEEKPLIPIKAAAAATADLDENLDPYTTDKDTTKFKSNLSTKSAASTRSTKKKKVKTARTKLKAPDSEAEDAHKPRSTIAKDLIEQAYHWKILSETMLRDPILATIQVRQIGDLTGPISKPNTSTDRQNAVKILLDLLQEAGLPKERQIPAGRTTPTTDSTGSSNKLDEYFQMALNRFLKEQNLDVDMESVGTPDLDSWEYDPDDLGIPSSSGRNSGRAAVATAAIGSGNSSSLIQRVRISAISDLKEFTGKDMDDDRARAWIGKVKSAFQRDQAKEEEKCLTFGDLMVGSAKNWHRQLSRTTKTKWADLLESFQTQYCGLGIGVEIRGDPTSEETPLDYLYRLNVAALRVKLKIKDGNPKARREHVDHYIETLGDPELADRLTLLRLADVDELEEVLRARERAKSRQRRSAFGSKFRQKVPASAPTAPARAAVRTIQTHDPSSESDGVSGSDRSDPEGDLRRIFLAAAEEKMISAGEQKRRKEPGSRIDAAPETEITKIGTAVLTVCRGNTQI
ncbi:LOW QUALITY PROTEIN: hypothetical protein PHMEG_00030855 [Phytophthora megakarya]|uniref:Eukaryotic/viral aspartic protease n=1 Tax=Phytophthora megakarya TaxID=4795 RepID=A0A225UXY2_9STRA|nr:LOW QUALITY PROTEIN: hypothetical protein PHMEG_00030855 [Phytophthora megakarya]